MKQKIWNVFIYLFIFLPQALNKQISQAVLDYAEVTYSV